MGLTPPRTRSNVDVIFLVWLELAMKAEPMPRCTTGAGIEATASNRQSSLSFSAVHHEEHIMGNGTDDPLNTILTANEWEAECKKIVRMVKFTQITLRNHFTRVHEDRSHAALQKLFKELQKYELELKPLLTAKPGSEEEDDRGTNIDPKQAKALLKLVQGQKAAIQKLPKDLKPQVLDPRAKGHSGGEKDDVVVAPPPKAPAPQKPPPVGHGAGEDNTAPFKAVVVKYRAWSADPSPKTFKALSGSVDAAIVVIKQEPSAFPLIGRALFTLKEALPQAAQVTAASTSLQDVLDEPMENLVSAIKKALKAAGDRRVNY